jgi:DNA-directed RNA polymerase subunit RPC12/RpoP
MMMRDNDDDDRQCPHCGGRGLILSVEVRFFLVG